MKNLLFFNKEGYPYNFKWSDTNERFEGKVYFDRNSNDTFKTIGLYIFEKVEPQQLSDIFTFETFRMFDYSGITFVKGNEQLEIVTNIKSVNSAPNFYSKWIFGKEFNKKFPIGSIITFENLSEDSFNNSSAYLDFNEPYYTVIDNKPNAILILTKTSNSSWNYIYNMASEVKIKSQNYIILNDYTGEIATNISNIMLDPGQTINVFNTLDDDNNGLYTVDERYKTKTFYNYYNISGGTSGDTLNIDLELLTERPKIYEGPINGSISGGTATINFPNKLNSLFEKDDFLNFQTGKTIIFEDLNDNALFSNFDFTITDIEDKILFGDYSLEFISEMDYDQSLLNLSNSDRAFQYRWILANPTNLNNYQYIPAKFKAYNYFLKLTKSEVSKIKSINYPDRYFRHRNYLGELSTVSSDLDKLDSDFKLIPGFIDNNFITFESVNFPGYYLRHFNYRIRLDKFGGYNYTDSTYELIKNEYNYLKKQPYIINKALGIEILLKNIDLSYYSTKSKWVSGNNLDNFKYVEVNSLQYEIGSGYTQWTCESSTNETATITWTNNLGMDVNTKFGTYLLAKDSGNIIIKVDGVEVYNLKPSIYTGTMESSPNLNYLIPNGKKLEIILLNGATSAGKSIFRLKNFGIYIPQSTPWGGYEKSPELQAVIDALWIHKVELGIASTWSDSLALNWSMDFLRKELFISNSIFLEVKKKFDALKRANRLNDTQNSINAVRSKSKLPQNKVSDRILDITEPYQKSFEIYAQIFLEKLLFFQDSSFKKLPGFSDSSYSTFQSYNFPDRYIRHRNFELWLDKNDSSEIFALDSTFDILHSPEFPSIKVLDELYFEPIGLNSNLNNYRKCKVIDIIGENDSIKYKLENKVIPEKWVNYTIYKTLKPYEIDTLYCSTSAPDEIFEYSAITYLTSNLITLEQEYLENTYNTIDSFIDRYRTDLNSYGVDVYTISGSTNLYFEGIYNFNEDHDITNYDKHFNISANYFNPINGYTYISGLTNTEIDRFWIRVNENFFENKRIPVWSDLKGKNHKIEVLFDLNNNIKNYGIRIKINSVDVYENFDTDTETTLNNLISNNYSIFLSNAIKIWNSGNTLHVEGLLPDVYIWDFDVTVNYYSTYTILKNETNQGIIIESSELINYNIDLLNDTELSTGMIITLTGSTIEPTGLTFLNGREYNIINLLRNNIQLSYQGYLPEFSGFTYPNMINESKEMGTLYLLSKEYIRRPRMGTLDSYINPGSFFRSLSRAFDIRYFEEGDKKDFYFRFSWLDQVDAEKDIFYYDFSGEQEVLVKGPKDTSGNYIDSLKYTGIRPLWNEDSEQLISLNNDYNRDTTKVTDPTVQQTIFEQMEFLLDKRNSRNADILPEPLQAFIGFNSNDEGVSQKTLKLDLVEYLTLSGYTNSEQHPTYIEFDMVSGNTNIATISYKDIRFTGETSGLTEFGFDDYGFEVDQLISLKFYDQSTLNQKLFENFQVYKITRVSKLSMDIDITNKEFVNFNSSGTTGGFYFNINVEPKEILRCQLFGETEIEDERFKINLQNLGIRIGEDIESLFEQSDINEEGIDYILLNKKRKEMLLNYTEVYNYIGSYKALINALKFFGYDNLQLYEYYRNIDSNSPLYQKLHKVIIPDIFDRTVEGWSVQDWVSSQADLTKFKKTNLFNLTYEITDDDGNYVLYFSLDEVQKKLEGIKKWLRRNILPLSTNILDITGVAETKEYVDMVSEVSNQVIKFTTERESSAINFFIEETLNFSTNYFVTINWYNLDPNFNPLKGWSFRIKTFSKDSSGKLNCQQSFEVTKYDMDSFNFSINKDIDPYIWVETCYFDENGIGLTWEILRNMEISRNYNLINNKLIPYSNGLEYLNIYDIQQAKEKGVAQNFFYFYDNEGFIYLSEEELKFENKDPRE